MTTTHTPPHAPAAGAVKIGKLKVNRDVLYGAAAVAGIAAAAIAFSRIAGGGRSRSSTDAFAADYGGGPGGNSPSPGGWPYPMPPASRGDGAAPAPSDPWATPPDWALPPPPMSAPPLPPIQPRAPKVGAPPTQTFDTGGFTFFGSTDPYRFSSARGMNGPVSEGGFVDPATGAFFPGSQFAGYTGPGDTFVAAAQGNPGPVPIGVVSHLPDAPTVARDDRT